LAWTPDDHAPKGRQPANVTVVARPEDIMLFAHGRERRTAGVFQAAA
jgi:hypothetical protein